MSEYLVTSKEAFSNSGNEAAFIFLKNEHCGYITLTFLLLRWNLNIFIVIIIVQKHQLLTTGIDFPFRRHPGIVLQIFSWPTDAEMCLSLHGILLPPSLTLKKHCRRKLLFHPISVSEAIFFTCVVRAEKKRNHCLRDKW